MPKKVINFSKSFNAERIYLKKKKSQNVGSTREVISENMIKILEKREQVDHKEQVLLQKQNQKLC